MKSVWAIALGTGLGCSAAWAQSTERVSISTGGVVGNDYSTYPSISGDGRFVAFSSESTNLVAGDTNGFIDAFVRDRQNGTTELVSVATGGAQGNYGSGASSISADGRFVVVWSQATNLVAGDTNGFDDIFVRDRQSGTTERVSVATGGWQGNSDSLDSSISADGRFVAFSSHATNLVAGDTNGWLDIFVRDRQSGTTELVSVALGGAQADYPSYDPSVSADGRFVGFHSFASNLVAGDTNGRFDVFLRDRQSGTTERVSISTSGTQGDATSDSSSISADGRFVAFSSYATNLVAGDTNGWDVFVRDRQGGTTERVSVSTGGTQANGANSHPSISADGRFVAFQSDASNLVAGDTPYYSDVFVRDRQLGTTEVVSISTGGVLGNFHSVNPSISTEGRYVAFNSGAMNLVVGDTNGNIDDVFVRDRGLPPPIAFCSPGVAGVIACPCSNPPSGPDHGCDNSAATGGAWIQSNGQPSLAADTLVFTTGAEMPSATSILLQGTSASATGLVFGQGVRCATGTSKRLYVKSASSGSITAPSGSDPSVSVRSAALGDPIQAGEHRYYSVYYRDPIALGGCPVTSTYNVTDGLDALWAQ